MGASLRLPRSRGQTARRRRHGRQGPLKDVVDIVTLAPIRIARTKSTENRLGKFQRGVGYKYTKSIYAQDWFDSGPERDLANILNATKEIAYWIRLQQNDLPILWHGSGREYNPDFIAIEDDDTHWIIEVKKDNEMTSADVQGKREAAIRWVQHVNTDEKVTETWRYLLLSETNVKTAKGSWTALKGFGE